jgi:hypothetical protein
MRASRLDAPDARLPGTLYLYRDRVRIIAGRFQADHERQLQPGDSSICPSAARGRRLAHARVAICSASI